MISDRLVQIVKSFAENQSQTTSTPPWDLVLVSVHQGQRLAKILKANEKIILLGTLLMDCQLGKSVKQGKINEHIKLGLEQAQLILKKDNEITQEETDSVMNCIAEHHGSDNFSSLEAEICCNADCYRFASIEGFLTALRYTREMPIWDLINLLDKKADEKYNATSLDLCKKEIQPQYQIIKQLLTNAQTQAKSAEF